MPKLTSLTTEGSYSYTFRYPRSITLEGIAYHFVLTSRHALSYYGHSLRESCFLREEIHQYNESLFLPSLIPRHHPRSPTVSILHFFFHTLSPSPLFQTKWNLRADRQLISFQQTTLTIVHSVQRGVTTHTQKTTRRGQLQQKSNCIPSSKSMRLPEGLRCICSPWCQRQRRSPK